MRPDIGAASAIPIGRALVLVLKTLPNRYLKTQLAATRASPVPFKPEAANPVCGTYVRPHLLDKIKKLSSTDDN